MFESWEVEKKKKKKKKKKHWFFLDLKATYGVHKWNSCSPQTEQSLFYLWPNMPYGLLIS